MWRFPLTYGGRRDDTLDVCGDSENGLVTLVNYNSFGEGSHSITLYRDDVAVSEATFNVATLQHEFLSGFVLPVTTFSSPELGDRTLYLDWRESKQRFVLDLPYDWDCCDSNVSFPERLEPGNLFVLEDPWIPIWGLESGAGMPYESGIDIIRGWVCRAQEVAAVVDGKWRLPLAYGGHRVDTLGVCGDTDNGFITLVNYSSFGNGAHELALYIDGRLVEKRPFHVVTLGPAGDDFLTGVDEQYWFRDTVPDFISGVPEEEGIPLEDSNYLVEWNEAKQRFSLVSGRSPRVILGPTGANGGGRNRWEGDAKGWPITIDLVELGPGAVNTIPFNEPYTERFFSWDMTSGGRELFYDPGPDVDIFSLTGLQAKTPGDNSRVTEKQISVAGRLASGIAVRMKKGSSLFGDHIEQQESGIYIAPAGNFFRTDDPQRTIVLATNIARGKGVRPWEKLDSELTLKADLKVPTAVAQGNAAAYVTLRLQFLHPLTDQRLWLVLQVFDTRGFSADGGTQPLEYVTWDSGETHNRTNLPMVVTAFHPGTRFSTLNDGSARSTGNSWSEWRTFITSINRDQAQEIFAAAKREFPTLLADMPTDLKLWELTHISVNPEVYYPIVNNTPSSGLSRLGMAIRQSGDKSDGTPLFFVLVQ